MAKYDQGGGCSCGLYKECVCGEDGVFLTLPIVTVNKYTIDSFSSPKIRDMIADKRLMVYMEETRQSPDISDCVGIVLFFLERDGDILVRVKIARTPKGEIVKNLIGLKTKLHARPVGVGMVDTNGNVSDYSIFYVSIDTKEGTVDEDRSDGED